MMGYMRDSRNPYGSEGGYVTSRDPRRSRRMRRMRDRGMDYGYDGRDYRGGDMEYDSMRGDREYSQSQNQRSRRDYESMGQYDMGYDDIDMRSRRRNAKGQYMSDGHYGAEGKTYYPIEAMGTFNGYWGKPQEDYGRYDMRGGRYGRDGNYPMYDYGDYGDYGESLTKEELEHWKKKLMKEVDEKDKHFFEPQNIEQKARQMGAEMKGFNAEELALVTLMVYTDYCKTIKKYIGSNMDIYIELAKDWLTDPDSELKGSERLAVYHDEIVMGGEDD